MPTQKVFDQLLIFVNLYQHAKNWAISLNCWVESILDQISGTGFGSYYGIFANNTNFH